ncbi:MAG: nitroreductase, partial [Sphingomonadales bacterium]
MFNDRSTPLSLLKTRRSGKPRELVAPGPDRDRLLEIVEIASRTPDHGKLFPWRFVIVPGEARDALAAKLGAIILAEKEGAGPRDVEAAEQFARQAPALIVLLSTPTPGHKIPLW